MALFNKLFSSSKRKNVNSTNTSKSTSQFPFNNEQVRILLYRECDWRGRRLLFDSSAVHKVHLSTNSNTKNSSCSSKSTGYVEISDGFGYKYSKPDADYTQIGEMVFGSVAMSFRGTALKVHWLQSPTRVLCSQVFLTPIQTNMFHHGYPGSDSNQSDLSSLDTSSLSSYSLSLSNGVSDNLNNLGEKNCLRTNPLDVPPSDNIIDGRCMAYSAGDSGYGGNDVWNTCPYSSTRSSFGSMYSEHESIRKLSIDSSVAGDCVLSNSGCNGNSNSNNKISDSSLQRRILRNISTSFETRGSMSDYIGYIGDNCSQNQTSGSDSCVSRYRRNSETVENRSVPEMIRRKNENGRTINRRAKLGLAVCITLTESVENEMESFLSEHITLLESILCRLRNIAENAYINRQNFIQIMLKAWHSTSVWIADLFSAPRLQNPVWLTMSCGSSTDGLANNFMTELCWLLTCADTKDTNFFISTLLTAILTHHLGWVSTMATITPRQNQNSTSTTISQDKQQKITEVSKSHPYSALWAQLSDLYGSIGTPAKISKTIICGNEIQTLDKVLNILTYFIRCGEVKREKREKFIDKQNLDNLMSNFNNNKNSECLKRTGLTRNSTCVADLSDLVDENVDGFSKDFVKVLKKNVMNDLPKVLAYNDSHFVKQELRIGNFLMDTGIEMNKKPESEIKLTVTSPENIEYNLNKSGAIRKTSIVETEIHLSELITANSLGGSTSKSMLWGLERVRDGIDTCESGVEMYENFDDNLKSFKRSKSLFVKSNTKGSSDHIRRSKLVRKSSVPKIESIPNDDDDDQYNSTSTLTSYPSLSELLTANSVGSGDRLLWGVEPVKENMSLEHIKHLELGEEINKKSSSEKEVVFVLGDDEALVGLKNVLGPIDNCIKNCNHKYKKHSGVKFNFEQYPQIATNYMKNKNLEISNYDFLEKGLKMEREMRLNYDGCSAGTSGIKENIPEESEEECECCRGGGAHNYLTTPSNASELEFSSDLTENNNYPSSSGGGSNNIVKKTLILKEKKNDNEIMEKLSSKHQVRLVSIPMPKSQPKICKNLIGMLDKNSSGFIPSLFTKVSDHYIPDMVLQGTIAGISSWESALKHDLTLASHCATLEQAPTENVAIIANTDKWDVKIVSSQTSTLPYGNGTSGPIGMSQLVACMLETVHAMWGSGTPSYHCMSFIESKLQEMYLQSETLAAFLLATEFCSLNTLTSALNLSANDVPLLLSVASIHSPQVTKKYGVSFR